jgi:hypothetical protein
MFLFQQRSEERQKKILRGEKLSLNEEKEEKDEFQTRRRLDKRKSDILTQHVFPSMANLVTFFEFASHPLLRADLTKIFKHCYLEYSRVLRTYSKTIKRHQEQNIYHYIP